LSSATTYQVIPIHLLMLIAQAMLGLGDQSKCSITPTQPNPTQPNPTEPNRTLSVLLLLKTGLYSRTFES